MRGKYSSLPTGEYDEENSHRSSFRPLSVKQSLRQQDERLEVLGSSVARLGELSLHISKEIDTQNRMLSELDTEVEDATMKV